jgi:1-acyl-sn-glycerol-3-phosphate acyltransferase
MLDAAQLVAAMTRRAVIALVRLLTAVRGEWRGARPSSVQCIYFANHTSHGDFALISAVLPRQSRARLRPVAAADYWLRGPVRRFVIESVFHGVLIDRCRGDNRPDPLEAMTQALDAGDSLLMFPEGTRNSTAAMLLPFRRGLYRLAAARPHVELVPLWIDNLDRVLPKGEIVPVPLLCTVTFGEPFCLQATETETAFLARARAALLALSPPARCRREALES